MPPALKSLLEQANTTRAKGRRDLAIMVVLYDTGARVQELVDLKARDVRLDNPAVITLTGKGNKKRCVPIMSKTLLLLKNYLEENRLLVNGKQDHPLFFNSKHDKFTRQGIAAILNKYFVLAKEANKDIIFPEILTPHMMRHSKAMHLLEAWCKSNIHTRFSGTCQRNNNRDLRTSELRNEKESARVSL